MSAELNSSGATGQADFFYNSLLANALAQLLPLDERLIIRKWLEKLHSSDPCNCLFRNDYMWFILVLLQSRKTCKPFDRKPPLELEPLTTAVAPNVYAEVIARADQGSSWIERVMAKDKDVKTFSAPPEAFLNNQPIPKHGVICYMAAFGDADD